MIEMMTTTHAHWVGLALTSPLNSQLVLDSKVGGGY